jgi:hypothetical protein
MRPKRSTSNGIAGIWRRRLIFTWSPASLRDLAEDDADLAFDDIKRRFVQEAKSIEN